MTFAAAPAQESEEAIAEPQCVTHISVADVSAPAKDKLTVDRTSGSSEQIETKKEEAAPVTIAAAKGTTKKNTKKNKSAFTATAASADVAEIPAVGALAQLVDSIRLASRFGYRRNPTTAGYKNHNGLNYAVPMGTPVKASASGTVVQVAWAGHSRYRMQIDHDNGPETSVNHSSALKVSEGQKVKVGNVVSLSGSKGNSTGPHLHLEVIVTGEWVNPESRL